MAVREKIAVVGGGAAGQMAAIMAARRGLAVTLFEKNEKLGKKLYITGKGRCNVTNDCSREDFFENIIENPRFLYSAYTAFDQRAVMELIEQAGTPLKVERGQRVFPVSDKSSDVLAALERAGREAGVQVRLYTQIKSVLTENGEAVGLVTREGEHLFFDKVILATGGVSYPSTGSTGEGLLMAQETGHTVTKLYPSLVPLETVESWPFALSGLTLKNVSLTVEKEGKVLCRELGEMLLTHFGVSGPLVLTASAYLAGRAEGARLYIDFKPGLTAEQLDKRLVRDLGENPRKTLEGAFTGLLPGRLLEAVLKAAGLEGQMTASNLTRAQRQKLGSLLKAMPLTVKRARGFNEAVVTRGGISVREVSPSTMESKRIRGLFFAGEMLDVDGFTGGFNLQIAWSTGALAGQSV